jgi:8-oxo-dGTP diphosphatase
MTAKKNAGRYIGPVVTTDAVVLRVADDTLEVLTHRRPVEPFAGRTALPGVYVAVNETIVAATDRCLSTKVGMTLPEHTYRATVGVHDSVNRDPRGHALSVVTLNVIPTGANCDTTGVWVPVEQAAGSAFDHDDIVAAAVDTVRTQLWRSRPLLETLVGTMPLTVATLLHVAEAVAGVEQHKSNLRTKALASGFLEDTGLFAASNGPGRPSKQLRWKDAQHS